MFFKIKKFSIACSLSPPTIESLATALEMCISVYGSCLENLTWINCLITHE